MSNKHGFIDSIKHMAFEEEPEAPKPAASPNLEHAAQIAPAMSLPVNPVQPMQSIQPIDTGIVADNDEIYKKILAKTDFEGTDVAATIHRFLDPLKAISDTVMPPNIKFKTAALQAKAQAGLTEEGILASFDNLKATLQKEQEAFSAKADQFAAREVSGRQDRINQITSQITQLQQELAKLSSELVDAQGKAARAHGQFTAAVQRRIGEIEQQKAQYTALLKG
jgi:hypothetical protein